MSSPRSFSYPAISFDVPSRNRVHVITCSKRECVDSKPSTFLPAWRQTTLGSHTARTDAPLGTRIGHRKQCDAHGETQPPGAVPGPRDSRATSASSAIVGNGSTGAMDSVQPSHSQLFFRDSGNCATSCIDWPVRGCSKEIDLACKCRPLPGVLTDFEGTAASIRSSPPNPFRPYFRSPRIGCPISDK